MADKAAASAKKGYKEAEQHEKAYQQQHGVFVYGKPSARKAGSARSKHVSTAAQSRVQGFGTRAVAGGGCRSVDRWVERTMRAAPTDDDDDDDGLVVGRGWLGGLVADFPALIH